MRVGGYEEAGVEGEVTGLWPVSSQVLTGCNVMICMSVLSSESVHSTALG